MEEPEFKRCPKCDCLMSFNQEVCHGCGVPGKAKKPKKKPAAKGRKRGPRGRFV